MVMSKKEFEQSKKPYTLVMSFNPVSEKILFSYFEGENNQDMIDKFKKDYPEMFHFSRQNKEARRQMCLNLYNYNPYAESTETTGGKDGSI